MNTYQITFTFHDSSKATVIKEVKSEDATEALMEVLISMNEDGHYNKNIKTITIFRIL